jgi:hypothetical protein
LDIGVYLLIGLKRKYHFHKYFLGENKKNRIFRNIKKNTHTPATLFAKASGKKENAKGLLKRKKFPQVK